MTYPKHLQRIQDYLGLPNKALAVKDYVRQHKIRSGLWLSFFLVLWQFCGMFAFYGPYRGVVVDSDTGNPLVGASVAAFYVKRDILWNGTEHFQSADETVTDYNGEFIIWPKLLIRPPIPFYVFPSHPKFLVITPNYDFSTIPDGDQVSIGGNILKTLSNFRYMKFPLHKLTDDDYLRQESPDILFYIHGLYDSLQRYPYVYRVIESEKVRRRNGKHLILGR